MTAAALSALAPGTAQATAPGEDGVIAGTTGSMVTLVNPDGTNSRYLNNRTAYQPAWSPDGSRIVVSGTDHAFDVLRADGTAPVRLPEAQGRNQGNAPAFTPDGRNVFFQADAPGKLNTQLYYVPSDGTRYPRALFAQDTGFCDGQPSVSSTWAIAFERSTPTSNDCSGTKALWVFDNTHGDRLHKVADDASHPDFSPERAEDLRSAAGWTTRTGSSRYHADGTGLHEIGVGSDHVLVAYRHPDRGRQRQQRRSLADRRRHRHVHAGSRRHSPIRPGSRPARTTCTGPTATRPSKPPSAPRCSTSRTRPNPDPNVPKANVAVLTRADAYYDGLAGSALAGFKNGPMLLTPNYGLADAVSAELAGSCTPAPRCTCSAART
ncbi:hypothetical protein ACU686_33080 [Yinghuangia aomiensis]